VRRELAAVQAEAAAPTPTAPLSVITRDDGSEQDAYRGKPLCDWKHDRKAGDVTAHGVSDVWAAARP